MGYPARYGLSDPFIAGADALHGDLLAAIDELRNAARLRPHVAITDRAEARFVKEALSALQGLYALFGSYLEHALQPLEPHISRDTVRTFILETRRELDDLGPAARLARCTSKPSPSRSQKPRPSALRSKVHWDPWCRNA